MKKTFFALALVALLIVATSLLAVISCGDDDDDDDATDDDLVDDDIADDDLNDDDNADDDIGDDDISDDDTTAGPTIVDVSNTGCKDGTVPPSKDSWPEGLEFTYDNGVLTVTHVNAEFNCCLDYIDVEMELAGFTIDLYEEEVTPNPCWCICPFDVVTHIANLDPGTYTVNIYANGNFALSGQIDIP